MLAIVNILGGFLLGFLGCALLVRACLREQRRDRDAWKNSQLEVLTNKIDAVEQERDTLRAANAELNPLYSDLFPLHLVGLPSPTDATPNEVISVVVNWPQLAAAIWQLLELAPHGVIVRRETP